MKKIGFLISLDKLDVGSKINELIEVANHYVDWMNNGVDALVPNAPNKDDYQWRCSACKTYYYISQCTHCDCVSAKQPYECEHLFRAPLQMNGIGMAFCIRCNSWVYPKCTKGLPKEDAPYVCKCSSCHKDSLTDLVKKTADDAILKPNGLSTEQRVADAMRKWAIEVVEKFYGKTFMTEAKNSLISKFMEE